jgi:predicted dehydrogenase
MKVGVVGLNGMGRHHAKVIKGFDFVKEVIGCDLNPAMRKAAGKEGIQPCVQDVATLLSAKPDAVFVVTAPAAHAVVIEACIQAGVPVFTEKPLAATLEDSRRLVELARRKNVPMQVGFELRYCGLTRAMKDVVNSKLIGQPMNMSLVQISGPHSDAKMTKERCGGIFYEKLCHQVDLFRYWLGEPQRIMAVSGAHVLKQYTVHDNVLSCMVFPGGKAGEITFMTSRAAQLGGTCDHGDRGHFYELILTCQKGSVSYCAWTGTISVVRYNHRKDCKSELVERFDVRPRYGEPVYDLANQDADFLKRVRDGKALQFPASDALKTMQWVAKAEKSLESGGKWISAGK